MLHKHHFVTKYHPPSSGIFLLGYLFFIGGIYYLFYIALFFLSLFLNYCNFLLLEFYISCQAEWDDKQDYQLNLTLVANTHHGCRVTNKVQHCTCVHPVTCSDLQISPLEAVTGAMNPRVVVASKFPSVGYASQFDLRTEAFDQNKNMTL